MTGSIGFVLDCADAEALAPFWTAALGYRQEGAGGGYVVLVDADGTRPKLLLQTVAEPKVAKNRMHVDVHVPDVDAEVARLEALGGRRVEGEARHQFGTTWIVMADPEGNEFCVCDGG